MQNKFEKQLDKNVKLLPVIMHNNKLWVSIQSELDFDEKLNLQIKKLPIYTHNPTLWNNIQLKTEKGGKLLRLYYITGIAASIMLFLVVFKSGSSFKKQSLIHSVEIHSSIEKKLEINPNSTDIKDVLQQYCIYSNMNCTTPDFVRIKSQLLELETEIQKLNQVISSYGESSELIKCLIRIENQKSALIDELLKS